jgi:hypothetical protein
MPAPDMQAGLGADAPIVDVKPLGQILRGFEDSGRTNEEPLHFGGQALIKPRVLMSRLLGPWTGGSV